MTHTKVKPLLPVAGKPVLDHVLDCLRDLPVSEYIFITGHLKEQVEEHIRANYSFKARFIEQRVRDGTAGACRLAEPYVREPVLILFVDTIFDANLSVISRSTDDGIIWAKEVEDYQRFGVIVHDEQGYVTRMVEKPDEPISKLANIGLYYLRNYKLFYEGIAHVFANDLKVKGEYFLPEAFMFMLRRGAKLRVEPVEGWYDCGKPETMLETNAVLLQHHHAIKSPVKRTRIHEPVFVGEECVIEDSVIGPNVSIADGCTIRKARLSDVIIDRNSTVENISLSSSILGENAYVEGESPEHGERLLLGDHSRVHHG